MEGNLVKVKLEIEDFSSLELTEVAIIVSFKGSWNRRNDFHTIFKERNYSASVRVIEVSAKRRFILQKIKEENLEN